MTKCRVCGKEYPFCKDMKRNPRYKFRWQEVACSPECGDIYFKRMMSNSSSPEVKSAMLKSKIENNQIDINIEKSKRKSKKIDDVNIVDVSETSKEI